MAATKPIIRFGIFDTTARDDAAFSATGKSAYSSLGILKLVAYESAGYATLELNNWLLNGTQPLPPTDIATGKWGVLSSELSDAAGDLATPLAVAAVFDNPHTSAGITIRGDTDNRLWDSEVTITWLGEFGATIAQTVFEPNDVIYFAEQLVEDYYGVVVEVTKTNRPHSRAVISQIQFGLEYLFGDTELLEANTVSEISPVSECVFVGQHNFTIVGAGDRFGALSATSLLNALQSGQEVYVSATIDEIPREFGTYYLDDWVAQDGIRVQFKCVDIIGMMSKRDCIGGMFNDTPLATVLNTLFSSFGVAFEVDGALSAETLTGWIPVTDCRTALQYVCFAIGAVAIVTPDNTIRVTPLQEAIRSTFDRDRKFIGQTLERRKEITDVQVTAHTYTPATGDKLKVLDQAYDAGLWDIYFDKPLTNYEITGATITVQHPNMITIDVAVAGTVTVLAHEYLDETTLARVQRQTPLAGGARAYLQADKCTLVSNANAAYVAKKLYDYYAMSRRVEYRAVLQDENIGEYAKVFATEFSLIIGPIVKMVVNLLGMVTTFQVVGNVQDLTASDQLQQSKMLYEGERPII